MSERLRIVSNVREVLARLPVTRVSPDMQAQVAPRFSLADVKPVDHADEAVIELLSAATMLANAAGGKDAERDPG